MDGSEGGREDYPVMSPSYYRSLSNAHTHTHTHTAISLVKTLLIAV